MASSVVGALCGDLAPPLVQDVGWLKALLIAQVCGMRLVQQVDGWIPLVGWAHEAGGWKTLGSVWECTMVDGWMVQQKVVVRGWIVMGLVVVGCTPPP